MRGVRAYLRLMRWLSEHSSASVICAAVFFYERLSNISSNLLYFCTNLPGRSKVAPKKGEWRVMLTQDFSAGMISWLALGIDA